MRGTVQENDFIIKPNAALSKEKTSRDMTFSFCKLPTLFGFDWEATASFTKLKTLHNFFSAVSAHGSLVDR